MKKSIYILQLLIITCFLYSCSGSFIKEPKESTIFDKKEYGILIISTTFMKNNFQELPLYITLRGDQGGSKEIRLDMEDDKIYVFLVKEGYYRITNIYGENNSPAVTRAGSYRETRDILAEYEWGTSIKAGFINYIGNLYIKDFSDSYNKYPIIFTVRHENYTFSADISVKKRMIDISNAIEKYPFLNKYNLPTRISILEQENGQTIKSAQYLQNNKNNSKQKGYGNFSWGTPVEEIKEILATENKKILVIDRNTLIDNTDAAFPIEFGFTEKGKDSRLSKVTRHLNPSLYDKTFASIVEKYGQFAKKEGDTAVWFTPYSKISLIKTDSKCSLIYEAVNLEGTDTQSEDIVK